MQWVLCDCYIRVTIVSALTANKTSPKGTWQTFYFVHRNKAEGQNDCNPLGLIYIYPATSMHFLHLSCTRKIISVLV